MVKSAKQRRQEIRAARLRRAQKIHGGPTGYFPWDGDSQRGTLPSNAVAADPEQLVHNNTYGALPRYYIDRAFTCRSCEAEELWTAKQQKWWYEIAKGNIDSTAIYCRACRNLRRRQRDRDRATHFSGLVDKYGLNDAARLLQKPSDDVAAFLQQFERGSKN